ncbi:retrovirus-related pol polyprotein from transposon TNT 1-94 [Tanacetum coccineum]
MSNTNTNLQTQTSNALHNAIMEAGGKDRPPMIDNDIYSTVDACPNACEMWKAIERLKQGETINVQDLETNLYWEFGKFTSKSTKPTNNNLRTSSNTSRANQDNTPRINRGTGYDNQRAINVVGARETVGIKVVQQSGIQCYNCKEYRHVVRECQKPKRAKDAAYDKEKMLLCKQEEAKIQLSAKQVDWRDDTDDEPNDQELKAHSVHGTNLREHPEQPESVNDTYLDEHDIIIDSLDMSHDREQDDQDDNDDLAKERDLLASLIKKLKCEIDDRFQKHK